MKSNSNKCVLLQRHTLPLFFFSSLLPLQPKSTPFPYTTLFRSRTWKKAQPDTPANRSAVPPTDEMMSHPASDGSPGTLFTRDRKSTRLNSSHLGISYAVFCLKKKNLK